MMGFSPFSCPASLPPAQIALARRYKTKMSHHPKNCDE
jgi:hypothetical protein